MTINGQLAAMIRAYLAETHESERSLSLRAGLNEKAVNQILHGRITSVRGVTLSKLAGAMGIDMADLLKGDRKPAARSQPPREGGGLTIREYDVGASAGYGAEPPVLNGDNETPILAEWSMPEDLVQAHTTPDRRLAIIRVEGDSMEPEYHPGERVLVDLSRRKPSPPGIFIIWDGMGLVLKRVELVPSLIPRRIRLSSINPGYTPYEVELDEHTIVARVIGKWQWR